MTLALPRVRVRFTRSAADSLSGWALASLLVHAAAIGLVLALMALPSRPSKPPDPGFFVRLADLPPAGGGTSAVPEAPRPPEEKPVPKAEPKPEPKPEPKEPVKKEVVLPDKPSGRPKKLPPAAPPHPSTKERAEGSADGTGSSPGTQGPGVPAGVPGGTGSRVEIADFQQTWYISFLLARLKSVWRPPFLPADATRTVTVSFVIHRDGSVDAVQIEVPSNYEPLNTSALRAVSDAAPFPRLPVQEPRDSVPARMVFETQPQGQ